MEAETEVHAYRLTVDVEFLTGFAGNYADRYEAVHERSLVRAFELEVDFGIVAVVGGIERACAAYEAVAVVFVEHLVVAFENVGGCHRRAACGGA